MVIAHHLSSDSIRYASKSPDAIPRWANTAADMNAVNGTRFERINAFPPSDFRTIVQHSFPEISYSRGVGGSNVVRNGKYVKGKGVKGEG